MENIPEYCQTRNAVRFTLDQGLEYLIKDLLLDLKPEWILSIMDYPKKGSYDVAFTSKENYGYLLDRLERNREH